MKDEIKKEMIKAIGTYNNSLVDSIAEICANVALKYIEQSRQAAVTPALPRFTMPSDDHLVKIAILFSDGKLDRDQLSAMVGMCQFVLDRIQENDDVTVPSSKPLLADGTAHLRET